MTKKQIQIITPKDMQGNYAFNPPDLKLSRKMTKREKQRSNLIHDLFMKHWKQQS